MDNETIKTLKDWLQTGSVNIFGLPFSGKDTQAKRLGESLGAPVVSGGDILRAYRDQELIKKLSSTGELFPSDFYLQTILPYLSRSEFTGKPLILSSLGRWHGEEQPVMAAAQAAGHPIKAAIFLKITVDELWRRFDAAPEQRDRGNRYDDTKRAMNIRLQEFDKKTLPVLDFYRQHDLLVEVDGEGDPAAITGRLLEALATKARQ